MASSKPAVAARPIAASRLLADQPPVRDADADIARIAAGRRVVVLDDDPTGTQTVADLPVLTTWAIPDLRWALQQGTTAFFVLTNTRSLAPADAAVRNREVLRALAEAARLEGISYAVASRSDSTLRGHFPLETDVITEELARMGLPVDGVVICPAYIEPGRITVDSVHWMPTDGGMIRVADSEFARDASFGYSSSDLRDWVEEKTGGRTRSGEVARITLTDLRTGGPGRVEELLDGLSGARPVVVDAATDADLRVLTLALVRAEAGGKNFVYRVGPSFVRARSGQAATPPADPDRLARVRRRPPRGGRGDPRPSVPGGLVVVGSHVGLTSRQLDQLRDTGTVTEVSLHVPTLLDTTTRSAHLNDVFARVAAALWDESGRDVVLSTSRTVVTGRDAGGSLDIARTISSGLTGVVREVVSAVRPSFVVAKGGITSSDVATSGLDIRQAWSRGTMLPGIVSLWEPVTGLAQQIPYVVFAGNVGDDHALAAVVASLRRDPR